MFSASLLLQSSHSCNTNILYPWHVERFLSIELKISTLFGLCVQGRKRKIEEKYESVRKHVSKLGQFFFFYTKFSYNGAGIGISIQKRVWRKYLAFSIRHFDKLTFGSCYFPPGGGIAFARRAYHFVFVVIRYTLLIC